MLFMNSHGGRLIEEFKALFPCIFQFGSGIYWFACRVFMSTKVEGELLKMLMSRSRGSLTESEAFSVMLLSTSLTVLVSRGIARTVEVDHGIAAGLVLQEASRSI